jgi:Tetratricopeptide repeat/Protein of unknown function (DUF2914)
MADTRDLRFVAGEAEQAAAAGDYASAEDLLREAAWLQEASYGPLHPDLANALNNLGIVCEITGKHDDAEACFRRAYAIATAVLEPDHPFVAMSWKNLEDFCQAHGKAVVPLAPPPLVTADRDVPTAPAADLLSDFLSDEPLSDRASDRPPSDQPSNDLAPDRTSDDLPSDRPSAESAPDPSSADFSIDHSLEREERSAPSRNWSHTLTIGALIAGALLLTFIATRGCSGSDIVDQSSAGGASASSPAGPAKTAEPRPMDPASGSVPRETPPAASSPVSAERLPDATSTALGDRRLSETPSPSDRAAKRPATARESDPPQLASAQLCRELSTGGPGGSSGGWRCVPPSLPVRPGVLFFYTRVRSPIDTSVQHFWYRGDSLRQVVELTIRANTGSGYRTYSRNTIDTQAGEWRLELRTRTGTLLHEERFVVR